MRTRRRRRLAGLVMALAALPACKINTTPQSVDGGPDARPVDARPLDATPVPPTVTAVAPAIGPTTGGIPITVTGNGFAAGVGVLVAGRVATVTAVDGGTITFTLPAAPGQVGPAAVVVTNADGGETIAVDGLRYYYGTLTFAAKVDYPTGAEPRGLAVVDLDGDQDLDIATIHRTSGLVAVSRNPGTGLLAASVGHPFSTVDATLSAADWNGDGKVDLATVTTAGGGVSFLFGDGTGGFGAYDPGNPRHLRPLVDAACAVRGDLDGNGVADLIVGYRNAGRGVGALLGNGAAAPTLTPTAASAADVAVVATGRIDPDGHDDVVAGVAGSVLVLRGNGAGGLAAPVAYGLGVAGAPAQLAIVDLDGDGDNDLVLAVSGGFGLAIFDNLGNGTFGPVVNLATTGNASGGIAAADLDLDGKADLVIANLGADSVTVRRGLGGGTYAPGVPVTVGHQPHEVFIVDLDRDRRLDVIVQNDTSGDFTVLRSTAQ